MTRFVLFTLLLLAGCGDFICESGQRAASVKSTKTESGRELVCLPQSAPLPEGAHWL